MGGVFYSVVAKRRQPADNGERLLTFAANHGLALVNTFFCTRKSGTSRTFNGSGQDKRIDYILMRQHDRKLVRDVKVHRQPTFLPISDHNVVTASETPWLLRSQPPGEGGKESMYRLTVPDD